MLSRQELVVEPTKQQTIINVRTLSMHEKLKQVQEKLKRNIESITNINSNISRPQAQPQVQPQLQLQNTQTYNTDNTNPQVQQYVYQPSIRYTALSRHFNKNESAYGGGNKVVHKNKTNNTHARDMLDLDNLTYYKVQEKKEKKNIRQDLNFVKYTEKLLESQYEHIFNMMDVFSHSKVCIDISDTGCGKTFTGIKAAMLLNKKPFIICPKSVIPAWLNAVKFMGCDIYGIANYEAIKFGKYYNTMSFNESDAVRCPYVKKIVINNNKEDEDEKVKYSYEVSFPDDVFVIFDEGHSGKNAKTLNSKLMVATQKKNNYTLICTATPFDKLKDCKVLLTMLGFIDEPKKANKWLKVARSRNSDLYDDLDLNDDQVKIKIIHDAIFGKGGKGVRMRIKDLGNLFPKLEITSQAYFCEGFDKIEKEYEVINDAMNDLEEKQRTDKQKKGDALAKIQKAWQRIELYKIPLFLELIEQHLKEEKSVVMIVNFKETVKLLAMHMKCDCILHGDLSAQTREQNLANFQNNKRKLIIATIQTGGVGTSMHDIHGGHQRVALINYNTNAILVKQGIGRTRRAGSKSDAIVKLIFCAKTYEEQIANIVANKMLNMELLSDGDLLGPKIQKEFFQEIEGDEIKSDESEELETKLTIKKKKFVKVSVS